MTGKDGCPSSTREREFPPPLLFCSVQALSALDEAHQTPYPPAGWVGIRTYPAHQQMVLGGA